MQLSQLRPIRCGFSPEPRGVRPFMFAKVDVYLCAVVFDFAAGGWRGVFGNCSVQHRVELGDVTHLCIALLSDDEDTRCLGKADALAQGIVGTDLGGKEAVGIDDEGHHATVRLEIFLCEGVEIFFRRDCGLVREYGAAILFSGLRRYLVLDVACDDRSIKAPDVHLEWEIVANERDLVLVHGCVDDREGAGAGGTFEIFELVDGNSGAGGRAQHRGVLKSSLGESGDAGWEGEQ